MALESNRYLKIVISVVLGAVILKLMTGEALFRSKFVRGEGYKVRFPKGWVVDEQLSTKSAPFATTEKPVNKVYVTKEIDPEFEVPAAMISMYNVKLEQATWIDDEFPKIVGMIKQYGNQIEDQGEIKVDERVMKWVLYFSPASKMLNLEFYLVDDTNMFYKLSYVAYPKHFNKYREDFELVKESVQWTTLQLSKVNQ